MGVIVNFILILLEILSNVTNVKLENDSSSVIYCLVIFDQKAISPGAERYNGSLYGVFPSINGQMASDLCSNGYQKTLNDLIKHFKESRYGWIKQGEVFMIQLLDKMVAIPVAIYYLLQSSSHEDIAKRFKEVLIYASSCSCCIQEAMQSQRTPQCNYFCRDCFRVRLSVKDLKGYILTGIVTGDLAKNAATKFRMRRRISESGA